MLPYQKKTKGKICVSLAGGVFPFRLLALTSSIYSGCLNSACNASACTQLDTCVRPLARADVNGRGVERGGRDWEHCAQLSYIRVRGLALHTQVLRANAVAMSFCARVCARCLSTLDYRSS